MTINVILVVIVLVVPLVLLVVLGQVVIVHALNIIMMMDQHLNVKIVPHSVNSV